MVDNKIYSDSLESIIKVEPEEFQISSFSESLRDNIFRSKSSIFSDPIVLLERIDKNIIKSLDLKGSLCNETVEILVRKGNEDLHCREPHTCCFCQKVFSSRHPLKIHIEAFHRKLKKMSCDLCAKYYFYKGAISHHMQIHMKKKFACNFCDYKTAFRSDLEKHKLKHTAKFKCKICNKSVAFLKGHLRTHRTKESCPICRKFFAVGCLNKHMKTHVVKCKICDKTLEDKEGLRRHTLRKHYKQEIHECHCGSIYKYSKELKIHQQSHGGDKIACGVCKKQFSAVGFLKSHWKKMRHGPTEGKMKILRRKGVFVCDKCGSKFTSRHSFQIHNQKNKFHCDLCPLNFSRKSLVIRHLETDHLKLNSSCKICGIKISTKYNLKTHMLQHGSKTECKICRKLVLNMSSHLKTHFKEKCSVCGKAVSKHQLARHIKTHVKK